MAVKIRLKRMGKIHAPFYRVVVMDARTKRDGRAIEEIGKYHPTEEPSVIAIDGERAQYWLSNGAQPTEAVAALLKITGDWQKFKGEPGTEGTLRVKEPKTSKKDLYEAALAAAGKSSEDSASTTPLRLRALLRPRQRPSPWQPTPMVAARPPRASTQTPTPLPRRPDRARGGPRAPRDGHRRSQGRGAGAPEGPAPR